MNHLSGRFYSHPAQAVKNIKVEKSYDNYGNNNCVESNVTACGPKICWTCPSPNYFKNWDEKIKEEVDPVRRNIYFGGVVCDFKPRSEINDRFCNRMFLNSPDRPPYEYASATDIEYNLRQGESSGCSPFWKFRYNNINSKFDDPGKFERVGPASFN
jgi:hypothetical protein